MNEVGRRLKLAMHGNTLFQPQEGDWFAWHPVPLNVGGWRWLCWVHRFKALGLIWEYFDIDLDERAKRSKEHRKFYERMGLEGP